MKKPVVTIFYQFDPWNSSIGGIQTIIRNFIKFSPSDFVIRVVGIQADATQPIGVWQSKKLAGRDVDFFPLFYRLDDDRRRRIPTSLRYAFGLFGKPFVSDFMHFHRLEASLFTSRWAGQKILFVHNDIFQQMRSGEAQSILWKRFPQLYFTLEKWLLPQFERVLSCNSESTSFYQQQYPHLASRISFIQNSFDPDLFYPLSTTERQDHRRQQAIRMGLPEDTQFLLFAGRLHPQKDPLLLLEALAELAHPNAHLLIAGDGEMSRDMTIAIERLNLQERVTMLSPVKQKELAHLHRIAHGCVLTSVYEGLPLVLLEALACGTPVVTTAVGETPRLLQAECGIVCRDRHPKTIASAWNTLLNEPERFPSQACVSNAQPFSAKAIVESIYNDMRQRWQSHTTTPRHRAFTELETL